MAGMDIETPNRTIQLDTGDVNLLVSALNLALRHAVEHDPDGYEVDRVTIRRLRATISGRPE
jgi:hypothetical protein